MRNRKAKLTSSQIPPQKAEPAVMMDRISCDAAWIVEVVILWRFPKRVLK